MNLADLSHYIAVSKPAAEHPKGVKPMFDHIPLMHMEWSIPGTPGNSERQLNRTNFHLLSDNIAVNADFLLDGSQSSLQCFPISDYARNHLLYLQAFSILYSRERYYTIRKNYNSFLILYTLEGSGILEYGEEIVHLSPGTGFFIDCRKPQYYHTDGTQWTHADLHFDGACAEHLFTIYSRYGGIGFHDSSEEGFLQSLDQLLTDYTHNISPYREDLTSCQMQHLILSMIQKKELQDSSSTAPDTIRYLIKYMENNYASPLSLDFLSDFAGLSKYHLSREFKRYTGSSPIDYLIRLRVQAAKQLLLGTNERIEDIAEEIGFHSLNNFINQFRKHAGMTPSQYRKSR